MRTARTLTGWRPPQDGEPCQMENPPPGMENPPWMENPPDGEPPQMENPHPTPTLLPVDRQTPVKT